MIYVSAVYANAEHTIVTGTDAIGNIETVPAGFTVFRQPEHGPIGFVANGGTIGAYVAPETSTEGNASGLDQRRAETAREEIRTLIGAGDLATALSKALELIP